MSNYLDVVGHLVDGEWARVGDRGTSTVTGLGSRFRRCSQVWTFCVLCPVSLLRRRPAPVYGSLTPPMLPTWTAGQLRFWRCFRSFPIQLPIVWNGILDSADGYLIHWISSLTWGAACMPRPISWMKCCLIPTGESYCDTKRCAVALIWKAPNESIGRETLPTGVLEVQLGSDTIQASKSPSRYRRRRRLQSRVRRVVGGQRAPQPSRTCVL